MKSVLSHSYGKVVLGELPVPPIGPYEALVRVEACGICNSTDTKIIREEFFAGPRPMAIGHESVGRIVELGSKVRNFRVGDRVLRPVLFDSHVPGGSSRVGGMSDYGVVIDGQAIKEDDAGIDIHWAAPKQQIVPASITPAQAAAMITMKETLHLLRTFKVGNGKPLAIVGTGPVGQAYCYLAKLLGASPVVVFGRREAWAEQFKALGADAYVVGDNYPPVVKEVIARGGFGQAIEAAGAREALKRCLEVVGPQGQVRLYGIAPESHSWDEADKNDPRVDPTWPEEEFAHDEMLQMVADGRVKLDDWISHILPAEECVHGFEMVENKQANKVILTF